MAGRIVVFLGAGASRAGGHALTKELLPEIVRRLDQDEFDDDLLKEHSKALRDFLGRLMPGASATTLPLITEILSIVDHCIATGEELIPSGTNGGSLSLGQARWLLERALADVVQKPMHEPEVKPSHVVDWIIEKREQGVEVAVMSTNYDSSVDRALLRKLLKDFNTNYARTDFGFTWRDADGGALVPPSADPLLRLYKLHGSLNWLGCNRCGHVYVNFYGNIVKLAGETGHWSRCECGFEPLRSVLVAPSFVRQMRDRNLLGVWQSATEALRLSDEWYFAGYSLPTEDVAIRVLLLRSLLSRDKAPTVHVVDRDPEPLARYRLLFPECRYTTDGLKVFLEGGARWQ